MAEPGRILQMSTMVPPARFGGAEKVVGTFADHLVEAGFTVRNEGLAPRGQAANGTAIPNLYWPFDGRRRGPVARLGWHTIDALTLAGLRAAERIVDTFRPQVMVTHNLRGWGLAPWVLAKRRGIPLIHVVHDYGLLCNTSTLWHHGSECGLACRIRAAEALRRWPGGLLIGVSQAVLAEHRLRGFGLTDPSVVIHPIAPDTWDAAPPQRGTPAAPTTFGYLGRLAPEKGIGVLVDAVGHTDATLIVAGEGEQQDVQALMARSSPNVQWWGWTEPAKLFEAIDVLVVPSLWREPFGLVVVEAARSGLPVLIADQPGLREAVSSCGARFHTFPAGDSAALRAALKEPTDRYRVEQAQPPTVDIVDLVAQRIPGSAR